VGVRTKTAFNPASNAGLMSDFGRLPIIQVRSGDMPRSSTSLRQAAASFSFAMAVWPKKTPWPEHSQPLGVEFR
jgi:hypothetical protein